MSGPPESPWQASRPPIVGRCGAPRLYLAMVSRLQWDVLTNYFGLKLIQELFTLQHCNTSAPNFQLTICQSADGWPWLKWPDSKTGQDKWTAFLQCFYWKAVSIEKSHSKTLPASFYVAVPPILPNQSVGVYATKEGWGFPITLMSPPHRCGLMTWKWWWSPRRNI